MDIHQQTIDFLRIARRLSEQAGDRLLTYLIDLAIEQSAGTAQTSRDSGMAQEGASELS